MQVSCLHPKDIYFSKLNFRVGFHSCGLLSYLLPSTRIPSFSNVLENVQNLFHRNISNIFLQSNNVLFLGLYFVKVVTCGFPPLEERDKSLKLLAGQDFFGGGALPKEETVSSFFWSIKRISK